MAPIGVFVLFFPPRFLAPRFLELAPMFCLFFSPFFWHKVFGAGFPIYSLLFFSCKGASPFNINHERGAHFSHGHGLKLPGAGRLLRAAAGKRSWLTCLVVLKKLLFLGRLNSLGCFARIRAQSSDPLACLIHLKHWFVQGRGAPRIELRLKPSVNTNENCSHFRNVDPG